MPRRPRKQPGVSRLLPASICWRAIALGVQILIREPPRQVWVEASSESRGRGAQAVNEEEEGIALRRPRQNGSYRGSCADQDCDGLPT